MNELNQAKSIAFALFDNDESCIDENEMERLRSYFKTSEFRLEAVKTISEKQSEIISLTLKKSCIFLKNPSGGSVYTGRYFSSCCRDLEFFLRYSVYAMLADDISILNDRVLNGLVETYQSIGVSINDTVKTIQVMKEVVTEFIGEDAGKEMAEYFDHLCNGLTTNPPVDSQPTIQRQENIAVETYESWEPKNYQEWLKVDKLAQQMQKNGVEDQDTFITSAMGFFESWNRMPPELKRKVWREREVMAKLYEKMNIWNNIPGFLSIGVAQRRVDGKEQLAGILNFEPSNIPSEQYYKKFDIPNFLKVESSIELTEGGQQEFIPIVIELMETFVKYSSSNVKSSVTTSKTPADKKTSSVLTLQSGDVLIGRNENGRFNESQTVTLNTLVISFDSENSLVQQVLSVGHGFKAGYDEAYTCEMEPYTKIGRTYYNSPRQKELAQKLDVALFKIENSLTKINSHLKWMDNAPELPIPVYARMPVQMYGGVSKHQTGYIDQSMTISPGPASSVVPFFTANIPSQYGDSGTLLVSGHHSENQESCMNKKYLSITNAMLGMLVEGSRGNNGLVTVFRPMIDILQQLKIRPYLT
ncbi:MAG: hypothetical protein AAF349_02030 [Cyanobacteria bacterium P01_A01_bin.68]